MPQILIRNKVLETVNLPQEHFISRKDAEALLLEKNPVEVFASVFHSISGPLTHSEFLNMNSIVNANFFVKSESAHPIVTPESIEDFEFNIVKSIEAELTRIGRVVESNEFDEELVISSDSEPFIIRTIYLEEYDSVACTCDDGENFLMLYDSLNFGTSTEKITILKGLKKIV